MKLTICPGPLDSALMHEKLETFDVEISFAIQCVYNVDKVAMKSLGLGNLE